MTQARHVLEAIAFGDDPRITPGDRLRACEQLARFDDADPPSQSFKRELEGLQGAELDGHLDALSAEEIAADLFGPRVAWPHLATLVDGELERRAQRLAEQIHLDHVEAEIGRRVTQELARRDREAKPSPVEAAVASPIPSADPSETAHAEPRYRPESSLRRRYRSQLISR